MSRPAHTHHDHSAPDHSAGDHSAGDHSAGDHSAGDQRGLAEMIDLDAEVLHAHHREVITWVASLVPGRPRIIDLGAGTGVATMALARQLPDAEVIAVDIDEAMLGHIQRKAEAADVAGRVRTVQADLDQPWPALGPADLVWAANSLHHVADPGHALAQAHAVLGPGGVLVINEMDSFPRFLPDEGGAALEDRAQAAMAEIRAEAGLHMAEDWGARLVQAGFTVEIRRTFDISLPPPLPAAAGRYAQVSLQRWRHGLEDRLGPADLAALDEAAASAPDRDDLVIRAARTVWMGRR